MNALNRSFKKTLKVSIVIMMALLPTRSLVAQGWLTPWLYRSSVTVTNSLATNLTDYQVLITLNTGNFNFAMAKTDGSDIRITLSNGTTLVESLWIESWTPGTAANIWVKVPSIPASGTTILFIYYGNTGASSSSSGTSTFDFFDDFESWSVTPPPHPSPAWQVLEPIPQHSADLTTSVYGNKIYAFGGYGLSHEVLNTVTEYDPLTGIWTSKAPMPTNRWGMVSVEFNSKIYVFGGQLTPSGGIGSDANEIYDPATNVWSSRVGNPLPLPDYGADGVVHPDVIYFPSGQDGYEYWMVYTPWPPVESENPSILRSHDGINWTDAGITNPVIPRGDPGAWNSQENPDPDMIYVSAINKWFMVWDGGDANSRHIALAYSSDGKAWTQYDGDIVNGNTNPVILSGTDLNGAAWETNGTYSLTCTPTLFYEGGTFYLYYAEEASSTNRGKIGLATFTWNNSTNSVVGLTRNSGNPIIDLPADGIFKSGGGHIDISKNPNTNTYHMYVCRELTGSFNFELSLLTSSSLTGSWTSRGKAIEIGTSGQWDDYHIYRSSPVVTSSGEIVISDNKYRVYYSAFGHDGPTYEIGIADLTIDGSESVVSVEKFSGKGLNPMPSGISAQGLMGVRFGDKIHLFYRDFHYEYDPALDTYTLKAPPPIPVSWGTCAVVGQKIYLIGGFNLGDFAGTNYNQVLDPAGNSGYGTWEQKTPLPVSIYGATRENPVIDGNIYVTHGWNWDKFYTSTYKYNVATDIWEQKGFANHPRDGVACGVINGNLYVVGGRDRDPEPIGVNYHEVYNPGTDTWTAQQPPSQWTTSGANTVFTDVSAKNRGNKGLIIRQPRDGTPYGLKFAEASNAFGQGFGLSYALDFDWNVTNIEELSEEAAIPEGVIRLTEEMFGKGSLFLSEVNGPVLRWRNDDASFQNLPNNSGDPWLWNEWHKVTIVRNGGNSNRVVFDGSVYSSLNMMTDGTGKVRFGGERTTQYLDDVRVRKWAGTDPLTTVSPMQALQGQWTGAAGTDWNNSSNWSDFVVPDAGKNVNIPSGGNQPVITTGALCNNITINSGATLQISGTNTLTVSGNWLNNGTFIANQSTVVFNGSSPQIGTGDFFNLTSTESGTKTFTSNASISGTLIAGVDPAFQPVTINTGASLTIRPTGKATVGALTNNGTLNLNSDATGIASLILGSYTDNGTENIQLYLTGGGNETENNWKWHYISSPVASLAVTDVIGSGAGGSSNNLAAYHEDYATSSSWHLSWFGYDGWNYQAGTYGGPTFGVLEFGWGYNYFYDGDATRIFGGAINTGSKENMLSYTGVTNNLDTKGWNLIGNPYTASISWNELPRSPSGIDNAIYFTKDNGFATYINGVGVPDGTTDIIPPMQGFFVKANQPSRYVIFNPGIRIHTDQNRYKGAGETIPLIRLKIEGSNLSDEAVIRFNEKAKTTFDSEFDALKFSITGTAVSLWTYIGSVNYSINSIPFPETQTAVPVGITSLKSEYINLQRHKYKGSIIIMFIFLTRLTVTPSILRPIPR